MELDIEDVFSAAFSSMLGRLVLFGIAILLACVPAFGGILAAGIVHGMSFSFEVLGFLGYLPLCLILSPWAVLNIPFLLLYLMRFLRMEGDAYVDFGVLMGGESLVLMLDRATGDSSEWLELTVAWFTWLLLLIMAETGIWLIRQYFINLWARDLGILRAENAQRNAERNSHRQVPCDPDEEHG